MSNLNRVDWRTEAACRGRPTSCWYTDEPLIVAAALAVCGRCPVRGACLDAALVEESSTWDVHGTRGGLTATARRRLVKARRRLVAVEEVVEVEQPPRPAAVAPIAVRVHRPYAVAL